MKPAALLFKSGPTRAYVDRIKVLSKEYVELRILNKAQICTCVVAGLLLFSRFQNVLQLSYGLIRFGMPSEFSQGPLRIRSRTRSKDQCKDREDFRCHDVKAHKISDRERAMISRLRVEWSWEFRPGAGQGFCPATC